MSETQETFTRPLKLPVGRTGGNWIGALERFDPLRLAWTFLVTITVLGVLGAARIRWGQPFNAFNLDGEFNVPAAFSAGLDFSAAVGAEALRRRTGKNVLAGLVLLFGFMALDEFSSFHEHLEFWTGVDWMKLYIPIFIYAGVAWIAVLREVRDRAFWLCLWGGAACWVVAQMFELLEWHGAVKQPHYNTMMFAEELLEMAGSALFFLGMLAALRHWRTAHGEPARYPARL